MAFSLFSNQVRMSLDDKINLLSNISTMLAAGIPILEVIDALLEESKGPQKKVLTTLKADLKEGNRIYTTLLKFPHVFDTVTVNLIKASEAAGTLETTLKDIRTNLQREQEFADKVKSALMYPVLVMIVFVAVMVTILVVVIPRMATVFDRLNVELPLPTKILIFFSRGLLNYTWPVLFGCTLVVFIIIALYRSQRDHLFNVVFSLPFVSDLVIQIDLTRFSRSLFLLLNSGLPIVTALELAQDVVMKKQVYQTLDSAREMVVSGRHFAEGLRGRKSVMPTMMIKLIEVGERSGSLATSMEDISTYMDYQVTKKLKTFTALLEPAMLVVVGVAVGGMMLAVISPMYSLISNVTVR